MSTSLEIDPLTGFVPVVVVVLALALERLRRRHAASRPRVVVAAVLAVYVAGVVANTLLPVHLGAAGSGVPWWSLPNLTPLADTEPADMASNVVVFLPLGVLLPLVARVGSLRRVLLVGSLTSLVIELVQWFNAVTVHGGHVPDVNDLLANTLGALVGYGVFRVALLVPDLRRWTAAATWPGRAADELAATGTSVP